MFAEVRLMQNQTFWSACLATIVDCGQGGGAYSFCIQKGKASSKVADLLFQHSILHMDSAGKGTGFIN